MFCAGAQICTVGWISFKSRALQRDSLASVAEPARASQAAECLTVIDQGWADFGFGALFHEDDVLEGTWGLDPSLPAHQTSFKSSSAMVC